MISRGLNTGHTEESATSINLGQGGKGSPNKFTLKPTEINKYIVLQLSLLLPTMRLKLLKPSRSSQPSQILLDGVTLRASRIRLVS